MSVARRRGAREQDVERDQAPVAGDDVARMPPMPDRLRDLLDLVVGSLDEPGADGRALARARPLLARPPRPAARRRDGRVAGRAAPAAAAGARGVGAARAGRDAGSGGGRRGLRLARPRSRARSRRPTGWRRARSPTATAPIALPAPNGVRFHPPAGVAPRRRAARAAAAPASPRASSPTISTRSRELLARGRALPADALARPLRPGFVAHPLEGEEPAPRLMAERLVATLEVWNAAIDGDVRDGPGAGTWVERLDRAGGAFARTVRRSATAAPGTRASSTRSASRRSRSPMGRSSRT